MPWIRLSSLLLLLAGTACRHAPPVGGSSFAEVDPLGAPMSAPTDASNLKITMATRVVVPPKPIPPLTLPRYPDAALAARLRDVHLAVTLTVDKEGRVTAAEPSLARLPYTTAFRDEFFGAIREAVSTWRFEPGQLAKLEPQPDGTPVVTDLEAVERTITLAFTFSHTGKVLSEWDRR